MKLDRSWFSVIRGVLVGCCLLTTGPIYGQVMEEGTECTPVCRDGYTCIDGQCVEKCNPPCPYGEKCTGSGTCVAERSRSGSGIPQSAGEMELQSASPTVKFKNGILFEIPWNGLVGFGVLYTFRPIPKVALEGGIGLSTMGFKFGFRGRYCFLDTKVSPFFGMGYMRTSGSDEVETTLKLNGESNEITFDLKPVNFMQITGGVSIVTSYHLTWLFGTGWAIAMNDGVRNVKIDGIAQEAFLSQGYDSDVVDVFTKTCDILYRGGLVLSVGVGFSL